MVKNIVQNLKNLDISDYRMKSFLKGIIFGISLGIVIGSIFLIAL
ncbi:MAG: hypothetical protein ACLFPQ_03640 [Candidatus Woesearchaeota archaeon]